jgi:flagellar biosynthetic protein FlhB
MSRQELRDELRQSEGDPTLRGRLRALQRRLAKGRMLQQVTRAQVVVTNPAHYAVALAYRMGQTAAPEVVAKGADLMAQRIVARAREHRVPIVPNPPLARALYRSVEVGQPIPTALYEAVAEVLAYVYSLRRRSSGSSRIHAGEIAGPIQAEHRNPGEHPHTPARNGR